MPRVAIERSAKWVAAQTKPGLFAVGGVSGLCLQVVSPQSRSWVLRATMPNGDRRSMGLGPYPLVSLAEARDKARIARLTILGGTDPIEAKRTAISALRAADARVVTFRDAAKQYIADRDSSWRNERSSTAWTGSLEHHAYPVIGDLLVGDVEKQHILQILKPIWTNEKQGRLVTAMRLRGRIEKILDYAREHGWRDEGPNPAQWKGRLELVLADPAQLRKVKPVRHQRAIAVDDAHSFITALRTQQGVSARCLELVMLTACRSGEARGARWSEIDLDKAIWTIPKERMKAGREHIVTLSRQAVDLIRRQPRFVNNDFVFPSPYSGGALSDMALLKVMRDMKSVGVPHGMRSVFRVWTAERTNYPREIAEAALAHTIGETSSERPYLRTSFFDKRRRLLQEWANFLDTPPAERGGNVVAINATA